MPPEEAALSVETLEKHLKEWQDRYLSLYRRLKLTCAYCGGNGSHDMGCVASAKGLDAFDLELLTPLAPLRAEVTPPGMTREEEDYIEAQQARVPDPSGEREAIRLLGFALFNHAKGNTEATGTLMRKAYKALAGHEWDAVV